MWSGGIRVRPNAREQVMPTRGIAGFWVLAEEGLVFVGRDPTSRALAKTGRRHRLPVLCGFYQRPFDASSLPRRCRGAGGHLFGFTAEGAFRRWRIAFAVLFARWPVN